jgi:two-component system chemotaxis response regulator CheY
VGPDAQEDSARNRGLKRLFEVVTGRPFEESPTEPHEDRKDDEGGNGESPARRPGRVVLVVDDAALIRQRVRRCLAVADIRVIEAPDGAAALEMLRANPDIALVVSDVHMPRMDGLQLLEVIREEESTRDLPFLVLTTETQATLVDRARDLHVQGWLLKPVRPDLLLVAVNKLIAREETGATPERAVP